ARSPRHRLISPWRESSTGRSLSRRWRHDHAFVEIQARTPGSAGPEPRQAVARQRDAARRREGRVRYFHDRFGKGLAVLLDQPRDGIGDAARGRRKRDHHHVFVFFGHGNPHSELKKPSWYVALEHLPVGPMSGGRPDGGAGMQDHIQMYRRRRYRRGGTLWKIAVRMPPPRLGTISSRSRAAPGMTVPSRIAIGIGGSDVRSSAAGRAPLPRLRYAARQDQRQPAGTVPRQ